MLRMHRILLLMNAELVIMLQQGEGELALIVSLRQSRLLENYCTVVDIQPTEAGQVSLTEACKAKVHYYWQEDLHCSCIVRL